MNLMRTNPAPALRYRARETAALTLIEVIGVLAVLAILAGMVLTALTKQTDKLVSDQESATLRAFGDGLQRAILRRSYIPGPAQSDWSSTIGNEVALDVTEVLNNARHQVRQFVIDPNFLIAGNPPPYQQTNTGCGTLPQNARCMILSSLGAALPNDLEDAIKKNTGDFNNIWNTLDGQVPPLGTVSFQGWPGKGEDLKIQRIDISSLFVHLVLSYAASTTPAYYSINGGINTTSLQGQPPFDSYFLKNSVLGLYSTNVNNLDSQQILVQDASFVYYRDGWRSTAAQNPPITPPFFIGAFDPGALAASFLATPGISAQTQLANFTNFMAFTNYMAAYSTWAANGSFTNSVAYDAALDALNILSIGLPLGLGGLGL